MPKTIPLPFEMASKNNKAWCTRIEQEFAIAAPVHEMVMPFLAVPRLDELGFTEEADCWDLVKARTELILQEPDIEAVGILVNDGVPAGQTVGHVHIHVIGLKDPALIASLGEHFDKLTDIYAEAGGVEPISFTNVELNPDAMTAAMRSERQIGRMNANGADVGHSIFTNKQIKRPNDLVSMTVQTWSEQKVRPYGLTNLVRVLNGFRDRPYNWPAAHLNETFEPVER